TVGALSQRLNRIRSPVGADTDSSQGHQVAVFVAADVDRRPVRSQPAKKLRYAFVFGDERIFAGGEIEQVQVVVAAAAHAREQRAPSIVRDVGDAANTLILAHQSHIARSKIDKKRIARGGIETARIDGDLLAVFGPGIKTVVVLAAESEPS